MIGTITNQLTKLKEQGCKTRIEKCIVKIKDIAKLKVKSSIIYTYKLCSRTLPVNKKIIVFESNLGRNYSGNIKAIYEEILTRGLDNSYKCIWVFEDTNTRVPGNCVIVKRSRLSYYYYMAIARYWIFDCRQPNFLVKRKETTYIQTWHGTPLKKLALDMDVMNMGGSTNLERYKQNFYRDSRPWDYLVSQNNYSTEIFRRSFAFENPIWEIGYPRNDILIKGNNTEYINALKEKLKLPNNKKVILYAPTWRDDEFKGKGNYEFNLKLDLDQLRQNLQHEYVIILKLHYLIMDNINLDEYLGFAYSYTSEVDIQELYLVSDAMITDYSSVMFDYSILKRPIIFFCYDIEKYENELRGFYFNLANEAPGPVVKNNQELLEAIKSTDTTYKAKYKDKYNLFNKKFNHLDDGQASNKIVDFILENI